MNPTRHVVIALTLSALVLFLASAQWEPTVRRVVPVRAASKAP